MNEIREMLSFSYELMQATGYILIVCMWLGISWASLIWFVQYVSRRFRA